MVLDLRNERHTYSDDSYHKMLTMALGYPSTLLWPDGGRTTSYCNRIGLSLTVQDKRSSKGTHSPNRKVLGPSSKC